MVEGGIGWVSSAFLHSTFCLLPSLVGGFEGALGSHGGGFGFPIGCLAVGFGVALCWLWVALGGLDLPQFRRSRHAGSETSVPVARGRARPPESTDCLSPTLFRPHSVRRLATYSREVSFLPCIPRNGEPASSDGKVFVPGPRLFGRKLCLVHCFRQVPPRANPLAFRHQPGNRLAILQ